MSTPYFTSPEADFEVEADEARNRPGSKAPGSSQGAWAKLINGQTIGKRVIVPVPIAEGLVTAPTNVLSISGDDVDATQVCLTICPPQLIGVASALIGQNSTNEQYNNQLLGVADIPSGSGLAPKFGDAFVTIDWGVGGVNGEAEVDISNGLSVNLQCSFLRVTASVDTTNTGSSDCGYVLKAFVGPGFPKANSASRTKNLGSVANGLANGKIFAVPKFAKRVYAFGANAAGDVFVGTVRFYRNTDATSLVASYLFAGNGLGTIDIPNGAYYWDFKSGIAAPNRCGVIFDLAI